MVSTRILSSKDGASSWAAFTFPSIAARSGIPTATFSPMRSPTRCSALPDWRSRRRDFPTSDPRWKDADSMELLARCAAAVREAGFAIANVDATIVVDRPKLAPFIEAMRGNVALRLGWTSGRREGQDQRGYGLYRRRHRHGRFAVACSIEPSPADSRLTRPGATAGAGRVTAC